MAIRNLRAIANKYTSGAVSPNFLGNWLVSQGYTLAGDAEFTGSVAGDTLTVSAIASGSLAVGSLLTDNDFELLFGTTITALGSGVGGVGTYTVSHSQTVAQEAMSANGGGQRTSGYTTFTGIPMNVQALSGPDLDHASGLNIQGTIRVAYLNGQVQAVQRPAIKGGDILQIPTGLTSAPYDTWLCVSVVEAFDVDGWSKVMIQLQLPTQSQ